MNETLPWDDGTAARLLRLEGACDRFEAAWRAGGRPRIEDYLEGAEPADRRGLFGDLLPLELHYRRAAGESPTAEEFGRRFPGEADLIARRFPIAWNASTLPATESTAPRRPNLPGFELLDELGRGGMGIVYKARQLKLDRTVALKMILTGQHANPAQLARFVAEAQCMARMRHPHIVQIHEAGEADGWPYLVLEFVDGGTLAQRLGRPQPPREAARLVGQLAAAVAFAHERSVVHRDLKPGNVLLAATGEAKVADFGLAKVADADGGLTSSGAILGSPSYMSPEQALGEGKDVGPAADIYALGVILFEMLTGRVPFSAETRAGLLRKVASEPAPAPRSFGVDVPKELEAICLKCLEKNPDRRYPSAAALADDLTAWLAGGKPVHAPHGALSRMHRRVRRLPIVAKAALALVVAALALVPLLSTLMPPRDDSLWRVRRSGKLVVGVDANSPPYAFRKDGRLTGFDVELARALAARLGVEAEHHELYWDWDGMRRGLDNRELDILLSIITVTEERSREVAFLEYATDPLVFVTRPGGELRNRRELTDKVLAVQEGTTAHAAADRLRTSGVAFRKIAGYRSSPELFAALRSGAADVALDHRAIARDADKEGKLIVVGPLDCDLGSETLGLALRPSAQALREAIGAALAAMKADGEFDRIENRWFEP